MTTWNPLLRDQFEWHWEHQLRPRLAGLSDEEYLWEPVAGSWSVRPRDVARTPMAAGAGEFTIDWAFPEPTPAHFDRAPVGYSTFSYSGTAAGALTQLEHELGLWTDGVRSLGEAGLDRPCGPAEGPFADAPLAVLVLHIHRELIHHLAEVSLLRDLYSHADH